MAQPTDGAAICQLLGAAVPREELARRVLRRVTAIERAEPDSVIFAAGESTLAAAMASPAGLILAPAGATGDARLVCVPDPRAAFARVYRHYFAPAVRSGIHPSAVVDAEASLGHGCSVAAGAVLSAGVALGQDCQVGERAVLLPGTVLGDRVRVQAGSVLGSDGFGYAGTQDGWLLFPQLGTLVVGDDVEIGSNVTIDRGALGETRIGRGTKIDNLVHIGHNCQIGERVLIAAQTGIAGSTVVGDGAILGGQVGLAEHVTIGPGVILGAQAGVPTGKKIHGPGQVFWGTPARPIAQYLRDLARAGAARGERGGSGGGGEGR